MQAVHHDSRLQPKTTAVEDMRMFTDKQLRRSVLEALTRHPHVSSGHIGVSAKSGLVTLSGHVVSNGQKDAASSAARHVKGVDTVQCAIVVAIPDGGALTLPV